MNDDFLHRIRTEPPPDFLARLKARLDLQPPPAPAAPVGSTLKKVLLGLLLSGCVFAVTLMLLNRTQTQAPAPVTVSSKQTPEIGNQPPKPAVVPRTTESKPPKVNRIADARPTALARPAYSYMTIKSLEPYLQQLMSRGEGGRAIVASESSTATLTRFCGPEKIDDPTPLYALVTRRMTSSELKTCTRNWVKVKEMLIGHQAIVLARSKLYGSFNLTPAEVFLALAAEVPDPTQPGKLIPNPNKMWSDVSSSLEREPIEFYGPEISSPAAVAFREIVLEPGCRALTTAEKCPELRKDGVYTEAQPISTDMLLKLQLKPNAIGILAYGSLFRDSNDLTATPIQGVVPTMETIIDGSYAGARPLYLYFNEDAGGPPAWHMFSSYLSSMLSERFAIIPSERSQP